MAEMVAVVLKKSGPADLDKLAEALGELRGWSREEAAQNLLLSAGIVVRDATKRDLDRLGRLLKKAGVSYLLLPTKELPRLRPVATQDLQVGREQVSGRGGEAVVKRDEFLVAVGGWLGEARFLVAIVARDGRTLLADLNIHRDGEKIVSIARRLLLHLPKNRISYAIQRVAKEKMATAKTEAATFPDETAFRTYVMWLATLAVCVEQAVSEKRKPYISRLGRVRFRWGGKVLDWWDQRRLEEAAVRRYARPVTPEQPKPRSHRVQSASRLPLDVGIDVAMLLEQAALGRVAVASAVIAAIMWLVLVIIRCCS